MGHAALVWLVIWLAMGHRAAQNRQLHLSSSLPKSVRLEKLGPATRHMAGFKEAGPGRGRAARIYSSTTPEFKVCAHSNLGRVRCFPALVVQQFAQRMEQRQPLVASGECLQSG